MKNYLDVYDVIILNGHKVHGEHFEEKCFFPSNFSFFLKHHTINGTEFTGMSLNN